ncbi:MULTISPECIES: nuclear transport factor 2 family protein [Nocardiopsis]|jgi:hypothetical protein|uniref:nuclear transport factor 2 family protein n=1 Tax=Nocardiopsis TaxID=2013 RepID=UPI0003625D7A|nr:MULTISPECIES: nuclear transport factor 2 family protein [Nocardiopsis]APC35418.1 DUF4440 domain-containing protein [Nocardiopsis dassonvillei]ASU58292.1 nuclear transport factor 2 family protein [Nocardiopsis dassonvillei]MCP3012100.1 nuclear transport factor 2 family protein [Nocardiopsis dassonvillei]
MSDNTADALLKELFDLEHRGWEAISSANADFYREMVTDDTVVVEHDGVGTGQDLVEEIEANDSPFVGFTLENPKLVRITDDSAVLTYRATAEVTGRDMVYRLYMTSVYARRDGAWRLLFHQQTPVSS